MTDDELQKQALEILGFTDASEEKKQEVMAQLATIADNRLSLALPELLTEEQMAEIQKMRDQNKDDETIVAWARAQLPDYDDIFKNLMLDIADELAAENMQLFGDDEHADK